MRMFACSGPTTPRSGTNDPIAKVACVARTGGADQRPNDDLLGLRRAFTVSGAPMGRVGAAMAHKVTYRRLADNYVHETLFDDLRGALEEAKFSIIQRGPTEVVVTDSHRSEHFRRVRNPY